MQYADTRTMGKSPNRLEIERVIQADSLERRFFRLRYYKHLIIFWRHII